MRGIRGAASTCRTLAGVSFAPAAGMTYIELINMFARLIQEMHHMLFAALIHPCKKTQQ